MELKVLEVSKRIENKKTVIINLITALCLNVSFWLTLMSMIGMSIGLVPVLLMIATQCLIFAISQNKTYGKYVLFYSLMIIALCLLIGYSFFGKAFMLLFNYVANELNSENGLIFVPFSVDVSNSQGYEYAGLALSMLFTAALLVGNAAIICVVPIVIGFLFGLSTNYYAFCFFVISLCIWISMRSSMSFSRTKKLIIELFSTLIIFVLLFSLIFSSFSSWNLMSKIKASSEKRVEDIRFSGDESSTVAFYITSNGSPKDLYFKTETEELDKKAYTGEYLGLIEYLAQENYYPCAGLYQFYEKDINRTGSGTKLLSIKIDNVSLLSKNLLVPYEVVVDDSFENNSISENFIQSSGIKGQRSYEYLAYKGTYTDYAESDLEKWAVVEECEGEKLYRKFVYDNYLAFFSDFDSSFCEEYVGKRYKDVVFGIRKYFDDNELDIDYCKVAVDALRYCGIPARVTSGYYLSNATFDAVENIDEETVKYEIYQDAAHTWVEIYVDTVGWLPVEVTPGFYSLYETKSETTKTIKEKVTTNDKNTYYDDVDAGDTDSDFGQEIKTLKIVLIIIIVLVVVAVLSFVVSKRIRINLIKSAKDKKSTFQGYRMLLKKLKTKKYNFDENDPYSLDLDDEYKEYLDLVFKERYSEHGLSQAERKQASEFVLRLVKRL